MTADTPETEIVSGFALTVAAAEPSPEAEARWAQRHEILANWLLAEWQRALEAIESCCHDGDGRSRREGHHNGANLI